MKYTSLSGKRSGFSLAGFWLVLALVACNGGETEGDGYFTPQIQEPFTLTLATEEAVAFDLEMGAATMAEGQAADGTAYRLEIPAEAYWGAAQAGTMVPVRSVSGLPSGFEFINGFHFSPDGVRFVPEGRLTITLPSAIATEGVRVVHYTADPVGDAGQTEAFQARLQPIRFESDGDLVVSVSGFSGVLLLQGDEVTCGRVEDADTCADLDEIIACTVPPGDDLQPDTRQTVNGLLRRWMELGLDELAAEPGQLTETYALELVALETSCWLGTAQLFNSDARSEFGDLLDRLSSVLQPAIVDQLGQINTECVALVDDQTTGCVAKGNLFSQHLPLLQLAELFYGLGIISLPGELDLNGFCEGLTDGYAAGPEEIRIEGPYTVRNPNSGAIDIEISAGTELTILPIGYDVFGRDLELTFGEEVTMFEELDPDNAVTVEGNKLIGNIWTPNSPNDNVHSGRVALDFRDCGWRAIVVTVHL